MKTRSYSLLLFLFLFLINQNLKAQPGPCNTVACSVCDVSATITSISGGVIDNNISTIAGNNDPGSTVTSAIPLEITATDCGVITIDVELDFNWNQGDQINWIHGISFENSAGWLAAEGVIIPANPGWLFFNSISGVCSDITYGAGYFWDPPGTDCNDSGNISSYDGIDCNGGGDCEADNPLLIDGDPSDNWGIDCETDCPQFGFSLTYCPTESGNANEVITFVLTEDGETGGWNLSDGCIFSLSFPITINSAGVQLPDEDIGPICQDSCVVLDAGTGCDDYIWSNGETTPEITVCPTETTTYTVTVSSDEGCELEGDITVIVEPCCEADAGVLMADPNILCPGESSTITAVDYQDDPAYTQVLILVDENGVIIDIFDDNSFDLTSDICETYSIYAYNYLTSGGVNVPQVNGNINVINCDIECCDLVSIEVTFEDLEAPIFTNPPVNMAIECIDELPPLEDLAWTDNCISNGMSIGEEEQSFTLCEGGEVTRTWTATDSCENEVAHTQTFTVIPVDIPYFIDAPQDMSLDCEQEIPVAQDLIYTNNQSGMCLITGSVSPTIETDTSMCGGTITYTWEFTDECNRSIDYQQSITLLPPPPPTFVNLPSNITIECNDDIPSPELLTITNNETGRCKIESGISPIVDDQTTSCGGTITYVWEYTDICGNTASHTQTITINPPPIPAFVDPPQDITTSCGDMEPMNPLFLNYTNSESGICLIEGGVEQIQMGDIDVCGGIIQNIWQYEDDCGRQISHTQNVTFDPAPEAVFIDAPMDITVSCEDFIFEASVVSYDNGAENTCKISGTVDGVLVGEPSPCGNSIQQIWTFTDECNRTISHTQNIEIEPAPSPTFANTPLSNISVNCGEIPSPTSLEYTNEQNGNCEISGTISGMISGNYDACGGTLVQLWLYTDECGETIVFEQFIEVLPADDPVWVDLPEDITIGCDEEFPSPVLLEYDNGATEDCAIQGYEDAVVIEGESVIEFIWTFTNECTNNTISHTQFITRPPTPELTIDPSSVTVCQGDFFDLSAIVVSDLNGGILDIQYFDANGQEIFDLNILVNSPTTITILGTNEDGCFDIVQFELNVDYPILLGGDGILDVCHGDGLFILYEHLAAPIIYDGTWKDLDGSGVNIIDPYAVNFDGTPEGSYDFEYTVSSNNACLDESVILTVNISAEPEIEIINTICNEEWTFYSVEISLFGNEITPSEGSIIIVDANTVIIENIPIDNLLEVQVTDPLTNCTNEYYINPPNCECPNIPVPISGGDQSICHGEVKPNLTVSLESGLIANWYDQESGGNLLVENSLTYQPVETEPGIYFYYVESVNSEGCISLTRTEIILKIKALPEASDVSLSQCASSDGSVSFVLDELNVLVNENSTFNFQYYSNLSDAENGINELDNIFTSSESETELTVKVTSNIGCISYASIFLSIIDVEAFEFLAECNDNGTDTDSDDDYYTITVTSPDNGSSNNTFEVLVDGSIIATFPYTTGGSFQLPAMGQSFEITLQDKSDLYCFAPQLVGPLLPCSNACSISANITTICNDGGTNGITDDDFYTITFSAVGINNSPSGYLLTIDGIETSTYAYNEENVITYVADGLSHEFVFTDIDDANCVFIFETEELNPCSGTCTISAELISVSCNNSDTNNDESDDTFLAEINITIMEGTGSWIIEPEGFTGESGITALVGPFDIKDGDVTLNISDASIPSCITNLIISAPEPCSICEELVEAGANATLDCDITSIDLLGSSSSLGQGVWTGPGSFEVEGYEVSVEIPGIYYFTVDFGQDCIEVDSVIIDVSNEIPIANAGLDDALTCEVDTVLLIGSVTGGNGNFEYAWYDEMGNVLGNQLELEVYDEGNYYFEVKDLDSDCLSPKDVVVVSDETNGPIAVIYADPGEILDCVIEVIYITNEVEQDVVYTWLVNNQPATVPNITIDQPSNIALFALDTLTGCKSNASLAITSLEEYPIVNMVSSGELNCADIEVTINGSSSQSGDNISYTWYDESNNIIALDVEEISVTETGTYYLELMDINNGCTNIDTIDIDGTFDYPILLSAEDFALTCTQNEIMIGFDLSENTTDFNISWSTEDGIINGNSLDSSIVVSSEGYYFISVIDPVSQCETNDTITVLSPVTIDGVLIDAFDENCIDNNDGEIIIQDIIGGTAPYTYLFGDILQPDSIITDLDEGIYNLTILDANGCKLDTSIHIDVLESFQVSPEPALITLEIGDIGTMKATVNLLDNEIGSIQWSPTIGLSCDTCLITDVNSNLASDLYSVTVTDIYGCSAEASVRLILEEITEVTFPNVISPNDDDINNYFTVYSDDENAKILSMKIFDRWGEMLFSKDSFLPNMPEEGWDGTFNSKRVAQGVYVYMVEMELAQGVEIFSGDVTIVK